MATHDEISRQAAQALAEADLKAVTAAFVASLSSRNLPARSAFGSCVVLQHFVCHKFAASQGFAAGKCAYCGLPEQIDDLETDERVMRYPFQVQHTDIQYAAHDLATFSRRDVGVPGSDDRELLQRIFNAIRSLPQSAQLGELGASLQGIIKSNKHERTILLETFGYAGILCPGNQRSYSNGFVPYDFASLNQPRQFYKREWAYPIRFWTGADGLNEAALINYFDGFL